MLTNICFAMPILGDGGGNCNAGRVGRVLPGRHGFGRGATTIMDARTSEDPCGRVFRVEYRMACDPPDLLLPPVHHGGDFPGGEGACILVQYPVNVGEYVLPPMMLLSSPFPMLCRSALNLSAVRILHGKMLTREGSRLFRQSRWAGRR